MLTAPLLEAVLYVLFNHNSDLLSVIVSIYKTDVQKGEWLGSSSPAKEVESLPVFLWLRPQLALAGRSCLSLGSGSTKE